MASPVDIASIFMRKGQTPTPETQTPSQGSSIIRSFFVREGGTEATPAPQRPNPVLSYFDPGGVLSAAGGVQQVAGR